MKLSNLSKDYLKVLNLVIRGIHSILQSTMQLKLGRNTSFKPCYKWKVFYTI